MAHLYTVLYHINTIIIHCVIHGWNGGCTEDNVIEKETYDCGNI